MIPISGIGLVIGLMNLYRHRFDINPNNYIGIGMDMMSESYIGIGIIISVQLYCGRCRDFKNLNC